MDGRIARPHTFLLDRSGSFSGRIEERQRRDLHIRLQPDRLDRNFHLQ